MHEPPSCHGSAICPVENQIVGPIDDSRGRLLYGSLAATAPIHYGLTAPLIGARPCLKQGLDGNRGGLS